ncbi:MAG: glycosyltransferase family 4 protein [Solirubrobacteraceae bacterium]|nr:glycosyltransferase family 4 protein [Solirubrobacteraceae bacterium]
MIIGIDTRALQTSRGVWRYLSSTLQALVDLAPEDEFRLLVPGDRPLLAPPVGENVTIVRPSVRSRVFYASSSAIGRPRMDRALGIGIDVFWLPANNAGSVSADVPLVLTVHDLSFELRPHDFTASDRFNHWVTRPRHQAHRADRIMVTTETVRHDVLERWHVDPAVIDVIHPGISRPRWPAGSDGLPAPDPADVAEMRARLGLPEQYVLQVGALEPRKRPELLVRAHALARTGAALVFAGSGRIDAPLRHPDVHQLGWVPDDDLDLLYAGALALCYPSMLEGYGFPPQEAALRGTPSIVSDLPALREVLGDDAALFVPAGDEEELAAALRQVAGDDALRTRLALAAHAVAAPRTWEATARGVMTSLRRASGQVA